MIRLKQMESEINKIEKILEKQKFLVITHSFGTGPPQELVKFLKKRVELLTFIDHPFFYSKDTRSSVTMYEKGEEKLKLHALPMKGPETLFYIKDFILTIYFALKTRQQYDICIACGNLNAFSLLPLRKIGIIKHLIYSASDFTPKRFENYFLNKIYHFVNKISCYYCDGIWNSAEAMIHVREKSTGIKRAKSAPQIITPDGNNFDDIKRYAFDEINRYDLVFMGHLRKNQGVPLIIEAMPEIIEQVPKAKLIIVGTGPLEDSLKNQAQKLGLKDKVIFKGFIEKHSDLEKILAQCAIALAPYVPDKDSFSYYSDVGKPKAYMACGLPVIITPVPKIAFEIAKEKAGLLIKYDKNELVRAAVKLLKHNDLYQDYRKYAITLAEKYKWSNVFHRAFDDTFKILGIDIEKGKRQKHVKHKSNTITTKNPLVSIIIPTYNRQEDLQICLNSILKQKYPNFEIIVVDDDSDDETEEIIKISFPGVKYIKTQKRSGVSKSKNIGIKKSKGDYLWFLDSDSYVPQKDILSNLVKIIQGNPLIGSIGGEIIKQGGEEYLRILKFFKNNIRLKLSEINADNLRLKQVDCIPTCNCFVSREILYKIGGFDEEYFYGGEDVELSKKIKDLGFQNVIDFRTLILHKRSNISRIANYKLFHISRMRFAIKNFGIKKFLALPLIEGYNIFNNYKRIKNISLYDIKGISEEQKKVFSNKILISLNYLFYLIYGYVWNIIFLPKTLKSKYLAQNFLA